MRKTPHRFCFMLTIRAIFLPVIIHLSRGQASLQVNPKVAEALIPGLHITVLHDGRLCSPLLWKIRTRAHRNYLKGIWMLTICNQLDIFWIHNAQAKLATEEITSFIHWLEAVQFGLQSSHWWNYECVCLSLVGMASKCGFPPMRLLQKTWRGFWNVTTCQTGPCREALFSTSAPTIIVVFKEEKICNNWPSLIIL